MIYMSLIAMPIVPCVAHLVLYHCITCQMRDFYKNSGVKRRLNFNSDAG